MVLIARGLDRRDESVRRLPRVTFQPVGMDDVERLSQAFAGCHAVAHCAGINREIGNETYRRVHILGTENVISAAKRAQVQKIVLLSFLRARPDCGSGYHESKWAAEELVRSSGLDYTVIKAGIIYGKGDHMLDHLSHALHTLPVFALVGMKDCLIRPLAVEDLIEVLRACLVEGRLSRKTASLTGPEELAFGEALRRVGKVLAKRPRVFRAPVFLHYFSAWCFELLMTVPLISIAQVRILSEGIVSPLPGSDELPADLVPQTRFTDGQILRGLPAPASFGLGDLRCFGKRAR